MKKHLFFLWVFILLLCTISLDVIFYKYTRSQGFQGPLIPFGTEIAVYILLAFMFFVLTRGVLFINSHSNLIAILLVLVGGFISFAVSIAGYFALNSVLFRPPDWYTLVVSSRFGFTRISAAMVFVIGLLRFLPDKKLWPEK